MLSFEIERVQAYYLPTVAASVRASPSGKASLQNEQIYSSAVAVQVASVAGLQARARPDLAMTTRRV